MPTVAMFFTYYYDSCAIKETNKLLKRIIKLDKDRFNTILLQSENICKAHNKRIYSSSLPLKKLSNKKMFCISIKILTIKIIFSTKNSIK